MRTEILRLEEEHRAQEESHRLFLEGTKQIAQRDREQCLKEGRRGAGCPEFTVGRRLTADPAVRKVPVLFHDSSEQNQTSAAYSDGFENTGSHCYILGFEALQYVSYCAT